MTHRTPSSGDGKPATASTIAAIGLGQRRLDVCGRGDYREGQGGGLPCIKTILSFEFYLSTQGPTSY